MRSKMMKTTNPNAVLLRLKDTGYALKDSHDDIRGRKVLDENGEEIGKVEELLVDEQEHKVRFLQVGEGGFLGIGETLVMIPVEAITSVDEHAVHINHTRDHVSKAPRYNPEIEEDKYWEDVCCYYGYTPFWMGTYIQPTIPVCHKSCECKEQ
jgi:sporulation protein YlmC with PRC-barrel domain